MTNDIYPIQDVQSWNVLSGCSDEFPCWKRCWAKRHARRLAGRAGYPEVPNHFEPTIHADKLEQPFHWRKPRIIPVVLMGDLFHDAFLSMTIRRIFETMLDQRASHHTFLVLTKRARRMQQFLYMIFPDLEERAPHVWIGVSASNQIELSSRSWLLRHTPAANRWISLEPLLDYVDIGCAVEANVRSPAIDAIVVGGESGPGARPMHPDWTRRVRDDCERAGVDFMLKQWGMWKPATTVEEIRIRDRILHGDMPLSSAPMIKVGKKKAGRLLDGRIYDWDPRRVT